MFYLCNTCHARYPAPVEACPGCGGFSIALITEELAGHLLKDGFSATCSTCSAPFSGTATLVHSKAAKMVYAAGVVMSAVVLIVYLWVAFHVLNFSKIPVFIIIIVFPSIVGFGIGSAMNKLKMFTCAQCGSQNIHQ